MDVLNLKQSKIKQDMLRLYFSHPEKQYYLRELERILNRPAAYIRRELLKLEEDGLFISEFIGKERFFRLNQKYFLYNEVKSIIDKTIGVEGSLRKILKKETGIDEVYIFGSYAKNKLTPESDIDLLIVGDNSAVETRNKIYKLQKLFNREINIVDMDAREFQKRKKNKDEFLSNIFTGKYIKLV